MQRLKRLAGKAAEALPAIVGSVVGVISSFLGKTVGFVTEHTWALIVFVVGVIVCKKLKRVRPLPVLVLSGSLFFCLGLTFLMPS